MQLRPAVAVDAEGNAVIVWQSPRAGGGTDVFAQRLDAAGQLAGPELLVNTTAAHSTADPAVAALPGGFIATWVTVGGDGTQDIAARAFAADGTVLSEPFVVNTNTGGYQTAPVIAAGGPGNPVIVWQDDVNGKKSVRGRLYEWSTGLSAGGRAWLDADGDGLREDGEPGLDGVTVKLLDSAGTIVGVTATADGGLYEFRTLRESRPCAIEFEAPAGLAPTRADAAGDAADSDISQYSRRTGLFYFPGGESSAILDAGFTASAFVSGVLYVDANKNGTREPGEQALQRNMTVFVDANGNGQHDAAELSTTAADDGSYVLELGPGTHQVAAMAQNGWAITTPPAPLAQSVEPGTLATCDVGMRSLAAPMALDALGPYEAVAVQASGIYEEPAVAMDGQRRSVVAWVGRGTDGSTRVYARRIGPDNQPLGDIFLVNPTAAGGNKWLDIACNEAGQFVIAWSANDKDVRVRLYNADGNPITDEIRPREFAGTESHGGRVAMDRAGNFIVTWQGLGFVGGGWRIAARRYNSAGVPLAPDFVVDSGRDGNNPMVAANETGAFVIVWRANPSSPYQAHGRVYNANGMPLTGEFPVSDGSANDPIAAMFGDGGFVAMWPEGTVRMGRRFGPDGSPLGPKFALPAGIWMWRVSGNRDGSFVTVCGGELACFDPAGNLSSLGPDAGGSDIAMNPDGDCVIVGKLNGTTVGIQRFSRTPHLAAISGLVWADTDENGLREEGEPGVANVEVRITDAGHRLVGWTMTGVDGVWRIGGLAPGLEFWAEFVRPDGSYFTQRIGDGDSDVDPATGCVLVPALADGEQRFGVDAGIVRLGQWTALESGGESWLVREGESIQLRSGGWVVDDFAEADRVDLRGMDGGDSFLLDFSGGCVLPGGTMHIDGGGGIDCLRILGAVSIDFDGVDLRMNGRLVQLTNVENVTIEPGRAAMDLLRVNGSTRLSLPAGTGPVLVRDLVVGDEACLDLGDNDLIMRGDTPAEAVQTLLALLRRGALHASAGPAGFGLMILANDDGNGQPLCPALGDHALLPGDILVRFGLKGDIDLSGGLDGDDYFRMDRAFLLQSPADPLADLNFDGCVNGADYLIIDNAFLTLPAPMPAQASAPKAAEDGERCSLNLQGVL